METDCVSFEKKNKYEKISTLLTWEFYTFKKKKFGVPLITYFMPQPLFNYASFKIQLIPLKFLL